MKQNKGIMIILLLVILLVGCRPPTSSSGGSGIGITMNFMQGNPPDKIYADAPYSNIEIPISIEVRNLGTYPTPDDNTLWKSNERDDVIFITGFDGDLINYWKVGEEDAEMIENRYPFILLGDKVEVLEGKNINNPGGGYDIIEFIGVSDLNNLNFDKYTPNFLITACYGYKTVGVANVCIDPRPFSTVRENKVCTVGEDVAVEEQIAPVLVTKIEQKALSNAMQFKIYFKNGGGGDIIATDFLSRCSGQGEKKLSRSNMDLIKIVDVVVGETSIIDDCTQLLKVEDKSNYVRLVNNQGFIVCSLRDYKDITDAAYKTPITIELEYGYRNSISQTVEIIKVPEAK